MRRITDNEFELLKICWEKGECTAREVFEESLKTKKRKYETIKTTMERMTKLNFLKRRKIGPVWVYSTHKKKEKFLKGLINDFAKNFINGNLVPLWISILGKSKLSKEDIKILKEKIEEIEEQKE